MSDGLHKTVMSARALSNSSKSASQTEDVRWSVPGKIGLITLNRPAALNALNLNMVRAMTPIYKQWQSDPNIVAVMLTGEGGRAFCAGGDVVAIRAAGVEGKPVDQVVQFFREEYKLNYAIATAVKPQVAMLNGFTMGGGVGLSVHGKYRVANSATVFAMPETAIGLFPDVGGTYFLPRLPGALGMYLALTGNRLTAKQVFDANIATHYISPPKEGDSAMTILDLEGAIKKAESAEEVETLLSKHCKEARAPLPHQEEINRIFSQGSVKQIYQALVEEKSEWANAQIKALDQASVFSLMLTHSLLQRGKHLNIADCLKMEFRAAVRCMQEGDFYEGVRAKLVDKEKTRPKFRQDTFDSFDLKRLELGDDYLRGLKCPELELR